MVASCIVKKLKDVTEKNIISTINIRDDLLSEDINKNVNKNEYKCPNFFVKIQNINTIALFDSGSEITCMSENFYKQNCNAFMCCAKLPINGKVVKGAIKGKSTMIKTQLVCELKIKDFVEKIIVIVVPGLEKSLIIGYDSIKELKLVLDPELEIIYSKEKGYKIDYSPALQQTYDMQVCEILFDENTDVNDIEYEKNVDCREVEITFDQIKGKLKKNDHVDERQKGIMADLIYKYRHVFNFKPGLIKDYTYKLKIRNDEPYHVKPYPIPLKYKTAVEEEINKMLESGVIRKSTSTFINPVVVTL